MKKITILDVARHAQVSKKTVSRVLNNEPNVSLDTKNKVRKSFDELGYRPNPQARGLATNQSFIIGLLYDNPNKSYITDTQDGALITCRKEGYSLAVYPEDYDSESLLTSIANILNNGHLDGLVLTPPFSDKIPLLELLNKRQIPYVRIAPTLSFDESPCVVSNDREGAYQMTRYLISIGHTRIGFIKGHPDHSVSNLRLEGYKQALNEAAIDFNPMLVEEGLFTFGSGEDCARKLLSANPKPTAIFASNDYMAAGVLKVAAQKRISVPNELSVCGFDNVNTSRHVWPSLTTIKLPIRSMAQEALRLLIRAIKQKSNNHELVTFNNELIVRNSTAPAP